MPRGPAVRACAHSHSPRCFGPDRWGWDIQTSTRLPGGRSASGHSGTVVTLRGLWPRLPSEHSVPLQERLPVTGGEGHGQLLAQVPVGVEGSLCLWKRLSSCAGDRKPAPAWQQQSPSPASPASVLPALLCAHPAAHLRGPTRNTARSLLLLLGSRGPSSALLLSPGCSPMRAPLSSSLQPPDLAVLSQDAPMGAGTRRLLSARQAPSPPPPSSCALPPLLA